MYLDIDLKKNIYIPIIGWRSILNDKLGLVSREEEKKSASLSFEIGKSSRVKLTWPINLVIKKHGPADYFQICT